MKYKAFRRSALAVLVLASLASSNAFANDYREKGKATKIASSAMTVTPPRDWNRLGIKPGKFAETWTLDGEQLNDVTFYGGVESGRPLVRERDKKREPLPKFTDSMLLIEIPELVQGTYRAYKQISKFEVTNTTPGTFLGKDGVHFTYQYLDADELPRKGEARAVVVDKKLFMVTFDAPRLHYFDRTVNDFRALADAASLK
jgi:hypothetical protein